MFADSVPIANIKCIIAFIPVIQFFHIVRSNSSIKMKAPNCCCKFKDSPSIHYDRCNHEIYAKLAFLFSFFLNKDTWCFILALFFFSRFFSVFEKLKYGIHLSIYLSIYLSICLSIYLSVCLSIHPSIHLSIYSFYYLIVKRELWCCFWWQMANAKIWKIFKRMWKLRKMTLFRKQQFWL